MPMMVRARRFSTLATTLAIVVACTNARCAHAQRKGGKQDTSYGEVIITEISYEQASPEDALVTEIAGSDDWVELYNPSKTLTVNLTGFALTDLTARGSMSSGESACLEKCVDRYVEATKMISHVVLQAYQRGGQ